MEIVVRRDRSCRADAYGATAYFGRVTDLGAAKRIRFENKKSNGVTFGICFRKRLKKIAILLHVVMVVSPTHSPGTGAAQDHLHGGPAPAA